MDLCDFLATLKKNRQLLEIDAEFDARFEIAALTDLVCKSGGPALLFNNVKNTKLRLVTNLFGNDQRMAAALQSSSLEDFGRRLKRDLAACDTRFSDQALTHLVQNASRTATRTSRVEQEKALDFLPVIRFWPLETRSFLTLAVVISKRPDSDKQNYGLYRVGVADNSNRHLTLNLHPGSGASRHLEQWQAQGRAMPIAVVLGADPELIFSAAASLPGECSEAGFSTYLRGDSFNSTDCLSVPLSAPASSQIVVEGWVRPGMTQNEGPFGCYTGNYGGFNNCPVIEISSVSMTDNPLVPLTLAGPLPMEDSWIARANLEVIRARLALDLPEISTIEMPLDCAFHGLYFVRCSCPKISVETLAQRIRGLDYMKRLRMLILLRDTQDRVNETDWRTLIRKIPHEQIWRDKAENLEALLANSPAQLLHAPQMCRAMIERLRSRGIDIEQLGGECKVM